MKKNKLYITKIPISILLLGIIDIIFIMFGILHLTLNKNSHYTPDYSYVNLTDICNKEILSPDDYKTLFYQTGLSPHAVNTLKEQPDFTKKIKQYQNIFFRSIKVNTTSRIFTTKTEHIDSVTYSDKKEFISAPVENGYLLYTPSSYTLGWRNGHVALVVNAEKKEIFEAASLGELSGIYTMDHWKTYPAFIMFRIKPELVNINSSLINNIITTTGNKLINLPYSLLCCITSAKNSPKCLKSHCAHIIWYAFRSQGLDLDNNRGIIVTPKNISECHLLEVVQIYGVDPDLYYDRIAHDSLYL